MLKRILVALALLCASGLAGVQPPAPLAPAAPAYEAATQAIAHVLTQEAQALTPRQKALLSGAPAIRPALSLDFTAMSALTLDPTVTFSRAGNAKQYDSTGKLTYAPNNLLTRSNTFSHADWTQDGATISNANAVSDPLGGTNASTLTSASGNQRIYQGVSSQQVGVKYTYAVWMRRRTGTGIIFLFDATAVNVDITSQVSSTWARVFTSAVATGTGSNLLVRFNTVGDAVDIYVASTSAVTYETTPRAADQVITTSAAYYGPRFDYDPATLLPKGLLIEEARTNLTTKSSLFSDAAWTKAAGITSATQNVTGPDGVANSAATILATVGAQSHQHYQAYTATAAAYAHSVIAKAGTANWLGLSVSGSAAGDGAFFNLSNGTIGTVAASTTARITSLGNGWYRCTITRTLTAATYYMVIEPHSADAQSDSFIALGTETIIVFGAQVELGAFATSYIPTAASSVTRAAESVTLTGVGAATLALAEYTVFMEFTNERNTGSHLLASASANNPVFFVDAVTPEGLKTYNNATFLATANTVAFESTTNRGGFRRTASGRSLVLNGGTIASDANVQPVMTGTIAIGSTTGGVGYGNGWMRGLSMYQGALADALMQAKATVGAPY